MRLSPLAALAAMLHFCSVGAVGGVASLLTRTSQSVIKPKFVIISMFEPEAEVWYGIPEFNVLARNITVPGLSPLFPDVHCTSDGTICQFTTGESEINAASTVSALVHSPLFDLTTTYFMVGGIAGVNPEVATLGSVCFARYAVQVALQYEIDAREIPDNWTTGYVPFGQTSPGLYPQTIYGTEVFEVSDVLRRKAIALAKKGKLNDTASAESQRKKYAQAEAYKAGARRPSVVACDVATSDVYYSGSLLGESFGNFTKLLTNGTGVYCTTAEEDNATLEALLRGAMTKLVDFSRIIVMRTASDFDRPYPGEAATTNLFYSAQAFDVAIKNIYLAGIHVVQGVVKDWESVYAKGLKPTNYIGDIFDSLGGTPDFGLPSQFLSNQKNMKRSETRSRRSRMARRHNFGV